MQDTYEVIGEHGIIVVKKTFRDKYTSKTDAEPNKQIISDDAYAIGELLEQLIGILGRFTK